MHVLILGAGVIGVTTAWYLRSLGHDVTVLEARDAAALNTSFANAGQLSYGYAMPWAAPGVPMKALKWLLDANAPFKLHLDREHPLRQALWLAKMFAQCNAADFEHNKRRMLALSHHSQAALAELRQALPQLDFDHQARGTLQVFRTAAQLEAAHSDARMLGAAGVACTLLEGAAALQAVEPALARSPVPLVGALRLPDDETGDCHRFTQQLASLAEAAGVRFCYGSPATGFTEDAGGRITGVTSRDETHRADAVVVCLGCDAVDLLAPLGLRLPVYPVKGYSLTFDIDDESGAPVSTVMDETYKVAITRLGRRVRVGGTAELSGMNTELREARRLTLTRSVEDLFPFAGAARKARFWTGLRPSTPDGVPYVGPTAREGLWVNVGHGTLGWTMAAGSARVLARALDGSPTARETALLRALG